MTKQTPAIPQIKWTDEASVASYLTSLVSVVIAILVLVHPGWHETGVVQALVPSVAVVITGIVQAVNVIQHRSLQKAIIQNS